MSRIYWDSMLFVYLLEANPEYFEKAKRLHEVLLRRGDDLYTSIFTYGEVMTGLRKRDDQAGMLAFREFILSDEVHVLPFNFEVADRYSMIRALTKVGQADGIHLASAAIANVEVFVTNDHKLRNLNIPGIGLFADLDGKVF